MRRIASNLMADSTTPMSVLTAPPTRAPAMLTPAATGAVPAYAPRLDEPPAAAPRACAGTYYAAVGAGGWEGRAGVAFRAVVHHGADGYFIDKSVRRTAGYPNALPVLLGENTCARAVTRPPDGRRLLSP